MKDSAWSVPGSSGLSSSTPARLPDLQAPHLYETPGSTSPAMTPRPMLGAAQPGIATSTSTSHPLLYLNSGIDGFETLIKAENAKTERRRHRDLLGAMIARQVTNSLLRAAIDEISTGEYGAPATGPTTRILQNTCEALARELSDTNSVEELYEKVGALNGNPTATAQFWVEADLALDRMTGLSDTITNVCKDVKHV